MTVDLGAIDDGVGKAAGGLVPLRHSLRGRPVSRGVARNRSERLDTTDVAYTFTSMPVAYMTATPAASPPTVSADSQLAPLRSAVRTR